MAPVRRLRSLAWMKARRLPGVRCSTLKTECRSLLCLMIMPGRIWVAGIDIAGLHLLTASWKLSAAGRDRQGFRQTHLAASLRITLYFTQSLALGRNYHREMK